MGGLFKCNDTYVSENTIKIKRLQYAGMLGQPGNIKVEVDFKQNVVLSGTSIKYNNIWGVVASPLVMHLEEVFAEKIRAAAQRAKYRDFYDLFFLIREMKVNMNKAVSLLRKKEIRSPITTIAMHKNWEIACEEKEDDLRGLYCSKQISNKEIEKMLKQFEFMPIKPEDNKT